MRLRFSISTLLLLTAIVGILTLSACSKQNNAVQPQITAKDQRVGQNLSMIEGEWERPPVKLPDGKEVTPWLKFYNANTGFNDILCSLELGYKDHHSTVYFVTHAPGATNTIDIGSSGSKTNKQTWTAEYYRDGDTLTLKCSGNLLDLALVTTIDINGQWTKVK